MPCTATAVLGGMQLGQIRQQALAQVRHENHGGDPRNQQGNGDHLENRPGVLARSRLRRGNRQEAGGSDQRAGEHGKGRTGPGIAGCLDPRKALLHFDRHHLHGDDRIVYQQPQRHHQRTQGNLVQTDTQVMHDGKRHRQHQRNRQGHHQAGAHTQREETHQQDNSHRLSQHPHKLANTRTHRSRLIGHLA